jgi:PTS system nitrogen regulatory IIA component
MLLSVKEAAALLRTTERQIYRWVDEEEIPFQRVRDQVRFNRTDLLEWATSRRLHVSLEAFDAGLDPDDRAPSLANAIRVGGVHHDVAATDRASVLRAIVELTPIPPSLDRELLVEVLIARENAASTAIGSGIAIPHVRQPIVAPGAPATVSVSHLRTPVAFGAPDHEPVKTAFLIVSPTVRTHLQMLAHVARALASPGFRSAIDRHAPTDEVVAEAARVEEMPSSMPQSRPKDEAD